MSHGRNLVVYHLPSRESETLESAQEPGKVLCLVLVHLYKGVGSHSLRGEVCFIKIRLTLSEIRMHHNYVTDWYIYVVS